MIRWRALLIRTGCSYLLRSSNATKGLGNRVAYVPLPKLGTEFGVHGIFEESYEKVEAEAENLSAASENPGVQTAQ